MAVQIQLRRDTAAAWASVNPTLLDGEAGFETDTGKFKIGDGSTAWNSLAYAAATPQELADGLDSKPTMYVQDTQPAMVSRDLWLDTTSQV